jgi:hypothetical protein
MESRKCQTKKETWGEIQNRMTLNLGSQSQMLGEFVPVFTGNKKNQILESIKPLL